MTQPVRNKYQIYFLVKLLFYLDLVWYMFSTKHSKCFPLFNVSARYKNKVVPTGQ